jgi:uncharacterized protein
MCGSCKIKIWPPSYYCPRCYSKTSLEIVKTTGTLLEFTNSYVENTEVTFGLVDMSGIKLLGSFDTSELRVGQNVKMVKCGVRSDGTAFYLFEPVKS